MVDSGLFFAFGSVAQRANGRKIQRPVIFDRELFILATGFQLFLNGECPAQGGHQFLELSVFLGASFENATGFSFQQLKK
jgi:hypothetical protein